MKRTLLLGGAGYIGHHMLFALLKQGTEVVVADNFSTGKIEHITCCENIFQRKVCIETVDVTNKNDLDNLFSSYSFDTVYYFAGLKSVSEGEANPELYFKVNVEGLANTLESINKNCKTKPNFIFSSSAAVYASHELPAEETSETNPTSVYGKTKLEAEYLVHCYSLEAKAAILRYFNPIGRLPGIYNDNSSTNLVPNLIKIIDSNKPIYIFGSDYNTLDRTAIRDYLYIGDLITGHLAAVKYLEAQKDNGSYTFNLGKGRARSVLDIINLFEQVLGKQITKHFVARRQGDDSYKCASIESACRSLNWFPTTTLSHAIETIF